MSGCGRERGTNAANKKLVDSFHPMNLFSRECSPCSNTSRQLQCTKIKEQIKMSMPPLIPWSSAVTNIEADLFPGPSHPQLQIFPFFTPFWTFQSAWSFVPHLNPEGLEVLHLSQKKEHFLLPTLNHLPVLYLLYYFHLVLVWYFSFSFLQSFLSA